MQRYLSQYGEHSYLRGQWREVLEQTRSAAAKLIGAEPEEIAFVKNTSEGLSFVANGIQWRSGDNIVVPSCEFPANVYPWMNLAQQGVEVRFAEPDGAEIPPAAIARAVNARTRLVAISAVQFATGFRADLAAIGRFCRDNGILFCVDAIQALGAFQINVRDMYIDFLSADAHKWLLGPEGIGIFYVRREILEQVRPAEVGWLSVVRHWDYENYDFTLKADARKFECGSYNVAGIYGLGGALELLHEVTIENISRRILDLTDRLVGGLRASGWRIVSPRGEGKSSGIVAATREGVDLGRVRETLLRDHRIVTSVRGGCLRISPHFYNSEDEIDFLVEVLGRIAV